MTENTTPKSDEEKRADQRAMDLGQEYKPDSDGEGMGGVIDAQAIEKQPLQSELEQAYGDGQLAAQEGKTLNDCPIMAGALCIEWVKGWKAWRAEREEEGAGA